MDAKLNGEAIVNRSREANGTLVFVTQYDGKDDKRPAEIRMTHAFNKSMLSITKEVRLEDKEKFFRRNAYELVR